MKRLALTFLFFLVLILAGVVLIGMTQPALLSTLSISLGGSTLTEGEQARLESIRRLAITQEKKQILINHTIFLGATPNMAELALGKPLEIRPYKQGATLIDLWVYHFASDSRPTVLQFQDGALTSAYKVSSHKLEPQVQEEQALPTTQPSPEPASAPSPSK